jgi:predicted  nucleic acid-binding Zn-ribbon protein
MWLRRRHASEPALTAADASRLVDRLASVERRMDDLEDLAHAALAPDRVDDLTRRVAGVESRAATREELVELRLEWSRLADELDRVSTALRAEIAGGDEQPA